MATPAATVIVPVRNESMNVRRLLERLDAGLGGRHKLSVLFVDDSKDTKTEGTINAAKRQLNLPNLTDVSVFHRTGDERWGGLSGAVVDGFKRVRAPYAIVMDGDLQHPPEVIPYIVDKLVDRNDLVIGSRYALGGSRGGLEGPFRVAVSAGCTKLAKGLFSRRLAGITDPMSGCFGIRLEQLDLGRLKPNGFKILLEILVTHPELKKDEVPLVFDKREKGSSKGDMRQGVKFLLQTTRLRSTIWREYPMRFVRFFCTRRFLNFACGGAGIAVIGALMLYGLVHIGLAPRAAFATQLAITLAMNFMYNYKWTWRDRPQNQVSQRAAWFLITRGITQVMSLGLFHALINTFEATSQLALQAYNLACLAFVVPINYLASDRIAFREEDHQLWNAIKRARVWIVFGVSYVGITGAILGLSYVSTGFMALFFLAIAAFNLTISSMEARWRLYTWNTAEAIEKIKWPPPVTNPKPEESYSIIIPCSNEQDSIGPTLLDHLNLDYPYFEIVVSLLSHDEPTIKEVVRVMKYHDPDERISMVVSSLDGHEQELLEVEAWLYTMIAPHRIRTAHIDAEASNKPRQLNAALGGAALEICRGAYVTPMDAESSPRPQLLGSATAIIRTTSADVLQGGVQLMNLGSKPKEWFKVHNVLEYFFWFSSRMFYQIAAGFVPLGGNTVFTRRELLLQAGGWETDPLRGGLTEDCELGVRLSTQYGAKIVAAYSPELATREETPETLTNKERGALVHQRVRWVQGFFSIFVRKDWLSLPTTKQRLVAGYILATPLLQAVSGLLLPMAVLTMTTSIALGWPKPHMVIAMLLFAPVLPLAVILASQVSGLHEFGKVYGVKVRLRHYIYLILGTIPYQIMLMAAAVIAVKRHLEGEAEWYKTGRANAHREPAPVTLPEPQPEGA